MFCFLVKVEVNPRMAKLYSVFCHPLIESIYPLCCYTRHNCFTSKVHLKPLIKIVLESRPPPIFTTYGCLSVQPGLCWSTIIIQLWGGRYLRIRDEFTLHAEGGYTAWICREKHIADIATKRLKTFYLWSCNTYNQVLTFGITFNLLF